MGVLDRDYMRDKGAAAKPQWADVAVPLHVLKREKRLKLLSAFIWPILVIGLLAAALTGPHHRQALNCKATSVTADANNDGRFTYQDVGSMALQAVTLPLKVVAQRNELQPVITFFELKPNECATTKAIVLSGALLLAFCVVAIWSLSLALLALRHGVKYLLFDALKMSPFGRWNAIVFRYAYPRFVWLAPPKYLGLLCVGLTAILLLKAGALPNGDAVKLQAQPSTGKASASKTQSGPDAGPYVNLYRQHKSELAKLDTLVASTPASVATSVDSLTEFLTRDVTSDLHKAYVIYKWITTNIDYDVQAFLTNNLRGIGAAPVVLKNRKAVCDGYAELFLRMANSSGLRAEKLTGFAKGYGYRIGESMKRPNHAWNAVQIDGRWYLLDSTWDAGSVDQDTQGFRRNNSDFNFFLTNPSHFIYTHLPENRQWQLLDSAWTPEEFYAAVGATDKAFRMGLRVDQHPASSIRVAGSQYEFDFATSNALMGTLKRDEKRVPGNWAMVQFDESGRAKLLVSAPDRGSHAITIFSSDQPQASVLASLLEYRMVFDSPGGEFPETFGRYLSTKTALRTPLQGVLKAGKPVTFSLTVPGAESVIVNVNGQTALTLDREGERFTGSGVLDEGDVVLFAKFSARERLDGLLKYKSRPR